MWRTSWCERCASQAQFYMMPLIAQNQVRATLQGRPRRTELKLPRNSSNNSLDRSGVVSFSQSKNCQCDDWWLIRGETVCQWTDLWLCIRRHHIALGSGWERMVASDLFFHILCNIYCIYTVGACCEHGDVGLRWEELKRLELTDPRSDI